MLTPEMFDQQAAALAAANGISLDLASRYFSFIGDTPEVDDEGKLVVRDSKGAELARLTAPASIPA